MSAENTSGQTTAGVNCPNCSTPMQEVRRYGADIDYCPSCKGVWLDRGEIDKIAVAQNKFDEEGYGRYNRHRDHDDDDDYYRNAGKRRKRGFFGDIFDFD